MYSKQDKERLMADWRESGLPLATWCRADPTRPTRATVTQWRRMEADGLLDVPVREVRGRADHVAHARYPEATKKEALRLLAAGMRLCDIARRLGVSSGSVVKSWEKAAERAKMSAVQDGGEGGRHMADAGGKAAPAADRGAGGLEARLAEAELEEARMELDVLRELMRDPKAGDPASLSNRQKAELGERLRRDYGRSLKEVTAFLRMPKSTYEYNRARLAEDGARAAEVAERAREAFEASGGVYGYRRVRAAMAAGDEPFHATEREVRRAMREGGMVARKGRRKLSYSSYAGETDERPANLPRERALERRAGGEDFRLAHDFSAGAPGQLAVTDVTEFKVGGAHGVPAAKVYLSPVIDCFDGMPCSWSISTRPDTALCNSSLTDYLDGLPEGAAPVVHTDGGFQYRSNSWKAICEERGVVRSMSKKACCPDNARAEGFFGTLKGEFYYGVDWSRASPEEFAERLDAFIGWYADGRLKAFREDGKTVYDTIAGRRRRLDLAA